jgi:hypothetical protein
MGFSVQKAVAYGIALFAGLTAGLVLVGGGWTIGLTLGFSAVAAIVGGVAFGFLMRDDTIEVAGASLETLDRAIRGAWALRSFRRKDAGGGAVGYSRGFGMFGDRFTAYPTGTGLRLEGPYNVIRIVKNKAAG